MFSPGDYREGAASSPSDAATGGVDGTAPDGAPLLRFLVIGGRREVVDGDTSVLIAETMRTSVGVDGQLTGWSFDRPPSAHASWTKAAIANGQLLLQASSTVWFAPFDGTIGADFKTASLRGGASQESGQFPMMIDNALLSAGSMGDAGPTKTVAYAQIDLADGGVNGWQLVADSELNQARASTTLHREGGFVYAIGGRDALSGTWTARSEVEVAPLGPEARPGPFAATTNLQNPLTSTAHAVAFPSVTSGGGFLFVAGGQLSGAGTLTDVVLAAKIDPANGTLGPWQALPRLPTPMMSGALLFAGDSVWFFGGLTAGGLSEAVIALTVNPDGTFGAEWRRVGTLPTGPRSSLVVTVY